MDARQTLGEPRALINRDALLHNVRLIRQAIPPHTRLCAIVKADAYGHSAGIVVDTLCNCCQGQTEAPAVDSLAVASIDEAAALPQNDLPVLILRPAENLYLGRQRARLEYAISRGWVMTVCTASAAGDIARIAMAMNRRANVQLMIDTGMTRSGCDLSGAQEVFHAIVSRPALRLTGVCTHFACSEEPDNPITAEQLQRFTATADALCADGRAARIVRHAANSGAVFFWPASHLDMVRPGLALYGIDPTCAPHAQRPLRPVLKWTAPLLLIRNVKRGTRVGYGQTWVAQRDSRIGLVPVGYADGYMRCFSNRAVMLVHGSPAPVVGRVSMDLTTLDLTDIPHATVGDEVTILDDDPLSPASVYQLARLADTIPYEIFCGIAPRIHRVAVESNPESAAQTQQAIPGQA